MSIIVETGAGVTSANAYVSVQDVINYHTGSTSSSAISWLALPTSNQEFSIVMAARIIDNYYEWTGNKQYEDAVNLLAWPRQEAYNLCSGMTIVESYIPANLKFANMELAIDIASNDNLRATDDNSQISSIAIDVIKVSYATKLAEGISGLNNNVVSMHIKTLLRCLGTYKGVSSSGIKFSSLITSST